MPLKKIIHWGMLATLFLWAGCTKTTFIETPDLLTDHMVLQQNDTVTLWGVSNPNVKITISGSWGAGTKVKTDAAGNWKIKLPTAPAGGPYELTISSGEISKTFTDVLLGEVWICSGQSNMEMPVVSNWAHVVNAEKEAAEANYPNIRLFTVEHNIQFQPVDTIATKGWLVCDTNTVKDFSASGYFFGRYIHQQLHVPVGLIQTAWGGTVAEAWTSKKSLLKLPDFAERAEYISSLGAKRDSLEKQIEADTRQMYLEQAQNDPGIQGTDTVFDNPDLNDTDWFPFDFPNLWEKTDLGNFDGSCWFRKTITLTSAMANSELTLNYAAVDDYDEVWFNGVKIGENKIWGENRKYTVPAGVAKAGKNVIAIRIYDYVGGGGFMGEVKDYFLASSTQKSIPLAKGWVAKKGFDFKQIKTRPFSMVDPNQPTVLFNGMIQPLLNYTIKGAIWYQGESNSGRAYQYRKLFKTMITDWREQWNQGDFPFLFVQLASFMPRNSEPVEDTWAELREAQTMALELPNTGMAVTIDIGDALDIHPGNKQDVGKRLALNALAKVYQQEIPFMGPLYKSFTINDNTIELQFDHVYDGLSIANGSELKGFAMAGADSVFHWAKAEIVNNLVVVSSNKVKNPMAVRYGWSANPECNLSNSAGLPASPFRTDSWKGITE